MRYCKKCLQTDTRPGIKFDENGVCLACVYMEKAKTEIDWKEREEELKEIAEWAKKNTKNSYNAVIGVSGGKDSLFQAVYAKEKLGLNVLLVNAVPDDLTEVGKYNIDNLVNMGFDVIKMLPNPKIMKKNIKRSFFEFGNPVKPTEYTLWASAYIIAEKFDIPLVIQGENTALTLGVTGTGMKTDGDALNILKSNTISGCQASDWATDDVSIDELFMYQFPDLKKINEKGIRAIFLQYYVKEWSQSNNADFAIARGMRTRATESLHDMGRFKRYHHLDSNLDIVSQMLKYYKFGFGFATDEACYDIREDRLSREDAIWLVNEYDGKCGENYIKDFCNYIDISVDEFWNVVDKYVNKDLFEKDTKTNKWIPKFKIGESL